MGPLPRLPSHTGMHPIGKTSVPERTPAAKRAELSGPPVPGGGAELGAACQPPHPPSPPASRAERPGCERGARRRHDPGAGSVHRLLSCPPGTPPCLIPTGSVSPEAPSLTQGTFVLTVTVNLGSGLSPSLPVLRFSPPRAPRWPREADPGSWPRSTDLPGGRAANDPQKTCICTRTTCGGARTARSGVSGPRGCGLCTRELGRLLGLSAGPGAGRASSALSPSCQRPATPPAPT